MQTQSTLEYPQQEGLLAPVCLVPTPEFKKGGGGEVSSKCRRQSRDCTLLKPEGFMRALAITTTICCAG